MPKPDWLEPLEQFAHFWMGFGARLTFLDYLLWRREWRKLPPENDRYPVKWLSLSDEGDGRSFVGEEYWAATRVLDMMTDMRWYTIGGTVADVFRAGLVAWWLYW